MMFTLCVEWSYTPFPLRPTNVRLYAHIASTSISRFESSAVCMNDDAVKRWAPDEREIRELEQVLAFCREDVDVSMIDDTSNGVSTLQVTVSDGETSSGFSVHTMASGYEGRDAEAIGRCVEVLSRILGADLSTFRR